MENLGERNNHSIREKEPPFFIIDRKGVLIDVNASFCKHVGYDKSELTGVLLPEAMFLTPDARKKATYRQVAKLIGKETPSYSLDFRTKQGNVLSVDITTKVYTRDGKIAGEVGIIHSISSHQPKMKQELPEPLPKPQITSENILLPTRDEKRKRVSELETDLQHNAIYQEKLRELQTDLLKNQEKASNKDFQIKQLEFEIERMKKETNTQFEKIHKKDEQILQLQSQLQEKHRDKKSEPKRMKLRKTESGSTKKDDMIRHLQVKLEDTTRKLHQKISEIEKTKKENEKKLEEIDTLNTDLDIRDKIIEEIEKQFIKNSAENKNKSLNDDEFDDFEQKYKNLKKQFTKLNKENNELKNAVDQLLKREERIEIA